MSADAYLPLLRMSIAMQNEPNISSTPVEIDPDRKKWLQEAISELTKNPVDEMKKALSKIKSTEVEEDEKVAALEEIAQYVEQIDLARDLHKIGGFSLVVSLLEDPSSKIRIAAAQVFGNTVHNNPEPQKWANDLGALNGLMKMMNNTNASPTELTKSIYGISTLIRQNDEATVKFVKEHKGIAATLRVLDLSFEGELRDEYLPAKRKAVFVLLYVLTRASAIVPATAPYCIVPLSKALKQYADDADFRENALLVLNVFSSNEKVRLEQDHRTLAIESASKVLEVSKQEDDEKAVELCHELLAKWKI